MSDDTRDALATELESLSIPARFRAFRLRAGLSQAELLRDWGSRFGSEPSKGWLSQVESGALTPSEDRRQALVELLRLSDAEASLLTESFSPESNPQVIGYTDWQAVRYWVAEYQRRTAKDSAAKLRAARVLDLLGDALREDGNFYNLYRSDLGRVRNLTDRSTEHRWLLMVEAAFMEPFAPFEPLKRRWSESRIPMLQELAGEMDLEFTSQSLECIESARHATFPRLEKGLKAGSKAMKAVALDKEIKQLDLGAASIFRAPLISQTQDPTEQLLAGAALVGTLGWNFVGGMYLTSTLEPDGTTYGQFEPGFPVVGLQRLLASSITSSPSLRKAQLAQAAKFNLPAFLVSIGRPAVNHELGKLLALLNLRHKHDRTLNFAYGFSPQRFQLTKTAVETNLQRVNQAYARRVELDDPGSAARREFKEISAAFTIYLNLMD